MARIKTFRDMNLPAPSDNEVGVIEANADSRTITLFAAHNMDCWPFFEMTLSQAEAEALVSQLQRAIQRVQKNTIP